MTPAPGLSSAGSRSSDWRPLAIVFELRSEQPVELDPLHALAALGGASKHGPPQRVGSGLAGTGRRTEPLRNTLVSLVTSIVSEA